MTSCSAETLSQRKVTVLLPPRHRWETMQNQNFWYTLVWNEGGKLRQRHLPAGQKRATVLVNRAETVVFCAYPLGVYAPLGGAVLPTGTSAVLLTEREGMLCHYLQESLKLNAEALERVNYPQLLQEARSKTDDMTLIDHGRLQKDLVNGELSSSSIQVRPPLQVEVTTAPQGYWVGERELDGSFWLYWEHEGAALTLGDGLHCFWNREDSLLLRIFVDLEGEASFISLQNGPLW